MMSPLTQVLDRMALATVPGIHLGLDRVEALLERLGHPEREIRAIHVAGTNGKGSVIAFLEAMLLAQGVCVATYTSPHLVRFNERFRIQGRDVNDEPIARALERVLAAAGDIPATWFEKITVAAFLLFVDQGFGRRGADRPSDWGLVLLETGMGGRLDATNVVAPLMTLITAIGLDHTTELGTDIVTIAGEKGGIMKKNVPALTSCGPGPAQDLLLSRGRAIDAPVFLPGRDYRFDVPEMGGEWRFEDDRGGIELPLPGLPGRHQFENAALAVAAARRLADRGIDISSQAIAAGLTGVRWPGRLERVPGNPDLLLDGAHNPLGMTALTRFLDDDPHLPGRRTVIFSALRDKNIHSMIDILAPSVHRAVAVMVGAGRGCPTDVLASLWRKSGKESFEAVDFADAWSRALAVTPAGGQIVVTGSLYLVGQVRSLLDSRRSRV
ncbi:MAG: bifunctional folylpolyglutamate synthase/dihydrofolate synthase [Magnetococcales bacterium]|nr:bifunctional folylpolyglutamate synthase/dihydrofolate synthase [Magnetococcales bacterium]